MKKLSLYLFLVLLMTSACSEQNNKCKGVDKTKWTNCFGKEKLTNGVYEGEYLEGKFGGQGTFTFNDGDKYVGEYKDGQQHGQGTYTYANGDKYVGGMKNGLFHGYGTVTHFNGTITKGIFKGGELIEEQ